MSIKFSKGTFKTFTGYNEIVQAIQLANKSRKEYQMLMHKVLVSAVEHKERNSQTVDLLNMTLSYMTSPKEKGSVVRWLCQYAGCQRVKDNPYQVKHKKGSSIDFESIITVPYWTEVESKSEQAAKWNSETKFNSLVALLKKKREEFLEHGESAKAHRIAEAYKALMA